MTDYYWVETSLIDNNNMVTMITSPAGSDTLITNIRIDVGRVRSLRSTHVENYLVNHYALTENGMLIILNPSDFTVLLTGLDDAVDFLVFREFYVILHENGDVSIRNLSGEKSVIIAKNIWQIGVVHGDRVENLSVFYTLDNNRDVDYHYFDAQRYGIASVKIYNGHEAEKFYGYRGGKDDITVFFVLKANGDILFKRLKYFNHDTPVYTDVHEINGMKIIDLGIDSLSGDGNYAFQLWATNNQYQLYNTSSWPLFSSENGEPFSSGLTLKLEINNNYIPIEQVSVVDQVIQIISPDYHAAVINLDGFPIEVSNVSAKQFEKR